MCEPPGEQERMLEIQTIPQTAQHHSGATVNQLGESTNEENNLMVIVVKDVGTGLMKSTEGCGFMKSHSKDDNSDNEQRSFHLRLNLHKFAFPNFMEQNHSL